VRLTKTGKVPIALRNGNAMAITGTVTLKQGKKTAGSATFALAAGAAKTVSFKLSRTARAALRRADFLRLSLRIVTRAGTSTLTTTKTLTIRRR
jgi:hypothetical protein